MYFNYLHVTNDESDIENTFVNSIIEADDNCKCCFFDRIALKELPYVRNFNCRGDKSSIRETQTKFRKVF